MEPKDFLRVLLRRRRTVVTAILIVVAVAMFGSFRKPATYAANCKIQIKAIGPGGAGGTVGDDPKKNSTETVGSFETMIELIHSPAMAAQVARDIKVPVEKVVGKINASLITGTQVFNFTTVDTDARLTSQLCNGYAQAFLKYRLDGAKEQMNTTLVAQKARWSQFKRQLDDLEAKILTANKTQADIYHFQRLHIVSNMSDVDEEIANLEAALNLGLEGAGTIIAPAGPTGAKIGPDHKKDLILGIIIGLIFGAALALVREYMDDTVKDKEGAQRDLGLSVLATMPFAKDGPGPDAGSIEAARTLRTNLLSQGLGNDLRVIVVTSTLAKRRATTLANLASTIAEAGRSVLVIGADLRNPRTHEAFGIGNAVGLTNVIRGQVPFEKAIRQVPGMQGVYVMPAGPPVGSPGELLSTDQMSNLVDHAREWADVVLLDAPPVLSAADASVLGTYADGVLLVMSAGQTLRAQATEAKEQLGAAGAKILGAVMFGGQAEPTQTGAGRILALPMLRRGDDDEDMGLTPYGWDGAQAGSFGGSNYGYDGDSYDNYEQSLGNDYNDGFGTGQGGFGGGYDAGHSNGGGYGNGAGNGYRNGGNGFDGYGNGYDAGPGGFGFDEPAWDQEPIQSPRARNGGAKPKSNGNGRAPTRTNGRANGKSNGHANGKSNGHANGKSNGHANGKSNGKTNGNGHANGRTKSPVANGRAKANGNGNGNGRSNAANQDKGGYANGRTNGNGNGHANGRNGGNSNGRNGLARTGNGNGNGNARASNGNGNGKARTSNGNGSGYSRASNGNGNGTGNGNGRARAGTGNGRSGNGYAGSRAGNGNGNGNGNGRGSGQPKPRAPRPAARRQYDDQGGW